MVPPGGPGPAFITIPGPLNEPFEIFIRADSFTYNVLGVQGGYAIIDDIEYFGEPCSPIGDGNEVLAFALCLSTKSTDRDCNTLDIHSTTPRPTTCNFKY